MSIWTALRNRYCAPEWAYFEEVRNGTGYTRTQTRTADALAFSLWPSRGIELHGFEVKVGRGDWLKEKNNPVKAEEIAQFCACWWLVTTKGVVKDIGEVPPGWGWLELDADGKKLVTKRTAPAKAAKLLDLPMIAAILRKASESQAGQLNTLVREQVQVEMTAERDEQKEHRSKLAAAILEHQTEEHRYLGLIHQLESVLGEEILARTYGTGEQPNKTLPSALVEKLQAFKQTDLAELRASLHQANRILREVSTRARMAIRGQFPAQLGRRRGW